MELAENKLLTLILRRRENDILETWKQAATPQLREQQWIAQRELDNLAGAIDAAIREHGGSRDAND